MSKTPPRANLNEIADCKNKDPPALSVFVVFTLRGFEVEPRADLPANGCLISFLVVRSRIFYAQRSGHETDNK